MHTAHLYIKLTSLGTVGKSSCKLPFQGCQQVGKAMSVPPAAVLGGVLIITSFVMSPAIVKVPGTNWVETVLVWLMISMPTGSSKTTMYQFLRDILQSPLRCPIQRSVIIPCVYLSCN